MVLVVTSLMGSFALAGESRSGPRAGASEPPGSVDEMFKLFGVERIPADFVVVVDRSGSMSEGPDPLYPRVLQAYAALIDAIPAGDNLSVILFASEPALVYQGTMSDGARSEAKARLLGSDAPVADGANTDIGSALDSTLRRLERADASGVQTVLFLTDGLHDPATGSAFPSTAGAEWDALRARATTVDSTKDLLVTGVGLGTRGAGGASLLRNVFGNPEVVNLPAEQLPEYFREAVRRSQLARLRRLVDGELTHGITVSTRRSVSLADPMTVEVPVTSELERLPVEVRVNGVTVTDGMGAPVTAKVVDAAPFVLGPGAMRNVRVLIEPEVDGSGFRFPARTQAEEFSVKLDATYQVLPGDLIAGITDTPTSGAVASTVSVDASQTYGWTLRRLLAVLGLVLLAAVVVLWVYRTFIQVPPLVGVLELDGPTRTIIELSGKHQRVSGAQIPGAGPARLDFFTRRRKRNHVFARIDRPPFYRIEGARRHTIADETEIRFGRYRLGAADFTYLSKPPARRD